MTHQKVMARAMAVLGGLAFGLSLLPTAARAGNNSNNNSLEPLSPSPSNNPTETNRVNGTTIPVWTYNENVQLTLPSDPLPAPSATGTNGVDRSTGTDNMNRSTPSDSAIPNGAGRTSGTTGGPSRDPSSIQMKEGTSKPRSSTTNQTGNMNQPNPNTPSRSNNPTRSNTNNGTTIPDQTINENQEINVPSDRTTSPSDTTSPTRSTTPAGTSNPARSTTPSGTTNPTRSNTNGGTNGSDQMINENRDINNPSERTTPSNRRTTPSNRRTTPSGTTTPNSTTPNRGTGSSGSTDSQNMNITPTTIPSGQGRSSGSTQGPSRDPSPGQQTNPVTPTNPTKQLNRDMANPSSNSVNTPGKPIARIATDNGKVSVRLKNDTNATITYQAIGHQAPRALRNGEEIVLRDLPTPVTLTMVREDGGFIQVQPASANDSKTLDLLLNEAVNYDNSVGVLRIQNNGSVFTN